jgi:hypothetical protein
LAVVLALVAVALLLGFLAWFLGAPLRTQVVPEATSDSERRVLEAARDAKYQEIRDNELDFRTGKLSEQDFREIDRHLRAQAVEMLHSLDSLR